MTRETLVVRGGELYDPINGVNGEVRDVWIKDGVVVDGSSLCAEDRERARVIDAAGCWVMPGGVDLHAHIAGKANIGRKLCPADHRQSVWVRRGGLRCGSGFTTPTTHMTAYLYAQMGYTTAVEAASSPLAARHAHEEFQDMPIIDKAMLFMFANNEFVLDCLAKGECSAARDYIAWTLSTLGGFGIKAVNPGGAEEWKWGGNVLGVRDQLRAFDTTPWEIVSFLSRTAEDLDLPHPLHLHGLNLGTARSAESTIALMDAFEGRRGHLCHLQFLGYQASEKGSGLASGATALTDALRRHPALTFDVGQIVFGPATTMTGDSPLEYRIHRLTGRKWYGSDMENESGSGVVPIEYRRKSRDAAAQWVTGMELFMLQENPWRICLTTDHPNAGPFFCYPQVIALLTDRAYREETLRSINESAARESVLNDIGREYSLYEIAIITRAAPARILGLTRKGHLGPGADGDVAVYDPARQGARSCSCPIRDSCRRMLDVAAWTIKAGRVVVRDGEVTDDPRGNIFVVEPEYDPSIETRLRKFFRDYYTMSFDNYAMLALPGKKTVSTVRAVDKSICSEGLGT